MRQSLKRRAASRLSGDARREARWWLAARKGALARRRGLLNGTAILWGSGGGCELVPIEVPRAGRGEVTIEVIVSAVSPGTERAQYLRLPNTGIMLPYRPGYSVAGIVRHVGPGVSDLRAGDLVAAIRTPHASIATVRAGDVFAIPTGVRPEDAALIRLAIVSGQGIRLAAVEPRKSVCVLGAGPVGALAQRLALGAGSDPVIAVATSDSKEAIARAGGVSRFLLASEVEQIEQLKASVVVEATGAPEAPALAVAAAGNGGRVVLLGSPRGVSRGLPVATIREKRLFLIGAHVSTLAAEAESTGADPQRELGESFLAALADNRLVVDDLVGKLVDPREAPVFYRDLARGETGIGALFDWRRVPASERVRRGRLFRRPDLAGRGIDFETPLPLAPSARRAMRATMDADPFAGASGHLRIGLLGCGDIAVRNAAAIAAAPNAELVACFDTVPALAEELGRVHGCTPEPAAESLLARNDVDAVFLAVPHHLHAPLAIQAAEAGRHVVVEKPPANDLSAAVEMVRAAERAGVVMSICFPHRYGPNVAAAKRLIDAGALGEFGGALLTFLSDKPASYWLGGFSGRSVSTWRGTRAHAGGGVLIMNLSHYIDLIRYLVGVEADSVTAVAGREHESAEVEDSVSISVRFANQALGSLFGCSAARGIAGTTELHVWGRDGHIAVEPRLRAYTLRAVDGLRPARWQSLDSFGSVNIRAVFVSRFATAVAEGKPPDIGVEDGLSVQAFIEAAYRSVETGTAVRPAELLASVAG